MDFILCFLLFYLVVINLISIIATISDKSRSKKNKWRVKEKTLFTLAILGGSVSMYITMRIIRHKTKHLSFMLGIPAIIVLQLILAYFIWRVLYV